MPFNQYTAHPHIAVLLHIAYAYLPCLLLTLQTARKASLHYYFRLNSQPKNDANDCQKPPFTMAGELGTLGLTTGGPGSGVGSGTGSGVGVFPSNESNTLND